MWGITDQNNSKYGHFLRSGIQERDHLQKQLFTGILENSSSENFGKFQGKKPWWCAVVDLHCECECFPGNFPKLKKLLKRLFRIAAFQFTDHSHSFYPSYPASIWESLFLLLVVMFMWWDLRG